MDGSVRDGAAVRVPPPLDFLGAVIAGVLVHGFVAPLPMDLPLVSRIAAGTVVTAAGLAFMGLAMSLFRRTGQDPKPWATTPEIISSGIYRFTRNPMYVGMALIQIAIGIGLANWWVILAVPVSLVLVYLTAIRHEEAYLERKFGSAYTDYKMSVRRWL